MLIKHDVQISMDSKGRAIDNIFVERFWRSVKYENVYLKGYKTIMEARAGLREYILFYNQERYHQSLGYKLPLEIYDLEDFKKEKKKELKEGESLGWIKPPHSHLIEKQTPHQQLLV